MDDRTIVIERRFHGPPSSGNGGYTCGRVAAFVGPAATVRLRVPPPLETPLRVERGEDSVRLLNGETVVAEARPWHEEIETPPPPSFEVATAAARTYAGFAHHWFPSCFVCGPERAAGDGLRLFPGAVPGGRVYACPWIPDATLAGENGLVLPEFLWAALDCPGAHSFTYPRENAVVLGTLSARLLGSVAAGERCVVVAWEERREGRKHITGTALHGEDGARRGVASAVWLEVPAADFARR